MVCLDNLDLLYLVSHFYVFLLSHRFLHLTSSFMDTINSIPIFQFSTPMETNLVPHESSQPIQTCSYRLSPWLIALVQSLSFLGEGDENCYLHIREFKQTCDCLRIKGISDETLCWKLFPFSLEGKARQWYNRAIGKQQGDWGSLHSNFCLDFYPISQIIDLRVKVLTKSKNLKNPWLQPIIDLLHF